MADVKIITGKADPGSLVLEITHTAEEQAKFGVPAVEGVQVPHPGGMDEDVDAFVAALVESRLVETKVVADEAPIERTVAVAVDVKAVEGKVTEAKALVADGFALADALDAKPLEG